MIDLAPENTQAYAGGESSLDRQTRRDRDANSAARTYFGPR
jgi:hypothetical protein